MKKLIVLVVVVAVALIGVWWLYARHVKKIQNSAQGDPVRAVKAFMNTVTTLSTLLWNEDEREDVKQSLDEWKKSLAKDPEAPMPEALKKHGIQAPGPLFEDVEYGKAAMGMFLIYQFDAFSVSEKKVGGATADITVEFLPKDVLGIRKLVAAQGAPAGERRKEPVSAPFRLRRRGYRWHIVEIGGEMGKGIEAMARLRKLR